MGGFSKRFRKEILKHDSHTVTRLLLFFWMRCAWHVACGILVPRPEIEPALPAMEVQSLNHWTVREVPDHYYFADVDTEAQRGQQLAEDQLLKQGQDKARIYFQAPQVQAHVI